MSDPPGNFPLGVDVGALSAWIASLKGHPRSRSRIVVYWVVAYGKATTPTAQHKPHVVKFPYQILNISYSRFDRNPAAHKPQLWPPRTAECNQ